MFHSSKSFMCPLRPNPNKNPPCWAFNTAGLLNTIQLPEIPFELLEIDNAAAAPLWKSPQSRQFWIMKSRSEETLILSGWI
ncbi:hypothetical protein WICPIJ_007858 [Wickerhamomyces pijperi]|uniref:Uncharacterized protein n=1 Tax=Wickerhamomyces pijperi TaxID=599730 RepID=A0A9P8PZ49_WICPI|nr:hypothetical protein WICPIJ_007858 [Wickerhamomyces pijperi]